jgi:hypothetical protein
LFDQPRKAPRRKSRCLSCFGLPSSPELYRSGQRRRWRVVAHLAGRLPHAPTYRCESARRSR